MLIVFSIFKQMDQVRCFKGDNGIKDKSMRKACIELMAGTNAACLVAGEPGTGRCLYLVVVMEDIFGKPTTEQWLKALRLCEAKAAELKYEVARIRGKSLAGL
ncbi:hypothetical protein QMS56_16180 [Cronobacter malonaticus]|nr:hypothetical protein [Cronobacter malonaticus]ELQ6048477.1 hypothetical protein [Cronobacter malonaticus]ELY6416975.1 hypothetical protein [Cronobacter malonaticus]EMD9401317.1 hypothetical protein [Cronobacter malonaticus]EMD9418547.1 hypothetical protein [Cronobacter malonaticus]MDI7593700.1 hypothetical protein [Cronobacter malonaticus]